MFKLKKLSREKTVNDFVNNVMKHISDDFTDSEAVDIVHSIKGRTLVYLEHRKEVLANEMHLCRIKFEDCINSIDKLK